MNAPVCGDARRAVQLAVATILAAAVCLCASTAVGVEDPQHATDPDAETTTPLRRFELGAFHVRDLRPTRDVTADLKFSLYLVIREDVSEAAVAALEHWRHRLRDQAITAIRTAQIVDFADPDLTRVRRLMNLRINRALPHPLVEEILVTTFTLGDL